MQTLSDLVGRIEVDLKTRKRYTGPPLLVGAAQLGKEVVVVDPEVAGSGASTTVQLNRAEIKDKLTGYEGSVVAVAELVAGDSPVFELIVPEGTKEADLTIGRGGNNVIELVDPGVSTHHAVLRYRFGRWTLEDLESRNGTYVNKNALRPTFEKKLVSCDCLRFGERAYYFLVGDYLLHFLTRWVDQRNP